MKTNIKLRRDTTQRAQPRNVTDAILVVLNGDPPPKPGTQVIARKQLLQWLEFLPGKF